MPNGVQADINDSIAVVEHLKIKNFTIDIKDAVSAILKEMEDKGDYTFDEEFIIYTTKLDLTDIKKKEPANVWLIVGIILGVIAVFLITFFIIKYI